MKQVREYLRGPLERALRPLAYLLLYLHVTPNQISVVGTLLNIVTGALVVAEYPMSAAMMYLVAGSCDLLDGMVARLAHSTTPFGAFLDSTLDRISEGVVFTAVAYWFASQGLPFEAALVVLALLGSFMVSYTRARAEAAGCECLVGIVTRAERVPLLAIGLFFGVLPEIMYLIVALTSVTVAQRVLHTHRELRADS